MPKRATHTYESEKDGIRDENLNVCFCLCCGESVLILGPGVEMKSLPRRKTDGAYVLERGTAVFKLNAKPGDKKLLKREKGFERQYRLNCWNCRVPIAYACEEAEKPALTYILPDALGAQADLYLQLYQVPPCIQSTGPTTVRVALEISSEQPKKAITQVNDGEVLVSVTAPTKDGLANAETIELFMKVFGCQRQQLQLARGWSPKSRFLVVTGATAVNVFKELRAHVETDILPLVPTAAVGSAAGMPADDIGPAATAGAASSVARRQWEEGEELEDLALAPSLKEQTFRA